MICMVWIDKGISSQIAEKRPGKILIYDLDITLKTGIFFQLKFWKIGTSRFLEVLKVKNRDGWQVLDLLLEVTSSVVDSQDIKILGVDCKLRCLLKFCIFLYLLLNCIYLLLVAFCLC